MTKSYEVIVPDMGKIWGKYGDLTFQKKALASDNWKYYI